MTANFSDYHLGDDVLKAISLLNFESPTEVQQQVIPVILDKKDIVVKSQTGSGKTAAFAIPICHLVDWLENRPQALVLVPTRELAIQVKEDIFNLGRFKRLKVSAIYGKSPFHHQQKELKQKTHVVVGTPGRIIDHIEKGTLILSNIRYLVLDEADEMLNMGFIEQIETIIASLPQERVTVLLSATMPKDIEALTGKYMNNPVHAEVQEQDTAVDRIYQERYTVEQRDKFDLLKDITTVENPDSCIIFCNTKIKVEEVYNGLADQGYSCAMIHGGMEQRDRLRVMGDFKQGRFRYLVATDVAARGIDIDNLSLIVNYDIPEDRESYVHRIGRTGRICKKGRAITFVSKFETNYLDAIQKYIGREIPLKDRPSWEMVANSRPDFDEKLNAPPPRIEAKGTSLSQEIIKIHINAGKKTNMRPSDIVGTLSNIEGMTAADIGIINVLDISTFVEILNDKGELVLEALQDRTIKGRIRKVSKVENLIGE